MDITHVGNINFLTFSSLSKGNFFNFSTTIQGGYSSGAYSSLNLSLYSGDNPDCVNENRKRIADVIGVPVEDLYIPYQVHEDNILIINETFLGKTSKEKIKLLNGVDALITNQKNICIGVTTADCVPVLIYDPVGNVFATVHAGWRGTVAKIVGKTIDKMVEHFESDPENILIGIGPCISQKYFEVGEEVVEAFLQADFPVDIIGYRNPDSGKMHIDLQQANKCISIQKGVLADNIEIVDSCTYSNPDKFFSARRQTINSGRMITGGILM